MPRGSHWGRYFCRYHGPPEIKEIIKKVYQLSFFTNGAKGQCVKVLCEYTCYQVLYLHMYCIKNSIIINK